MAVQVPIPTNEQLDVSNLAMMLRGLRVHCPICNEKKTHQRFATLVDRCPTCSFNYERIDGHSIGYIGVNTIFTFGLLFLTFMIGALLMYPDMDEQTLTIAAIVPGVVFPILFTPVSQTLWTAFDLVTRPLEVGEIDPRFVVVEPGLRDRGRG